MWENEWITAPSAIETPGPITTNGSIVTSLPKRGIGGEIDRIGRDQGDAGLQRRLAQPRLHHGFGFGELGLGVDAAHFILAGFDHDRLQSQVPDDRNRVGQIILALAVGITDFFDDFQRPAPSNAITPALLSLIARSAALASACSRIATSRPPSTRSRP